MTRALILAHYDADGVVADYVVDALRQYRRTCDRLVLVSAGAARLPAAAAPLVDTFITRGNIGRDFCSWRAGIEALGSVAPYDELIIANDSVYGPLFDLEPVFADHRVAEADLWGMCLSTQGTKRRGRRASCPHVQSWFLAMRRPVLASAAFRRFWDAVVPLERKDDVVDRYEIGMSEHFARAGFRIAGIYDARDHRPASLREMRPHLAWRAPRRSWRLFKKSRRVPHNPSELFPARLIEAGVPFVKAGVFRVNHYGLNLDHVLGGIRRSTPYDIGLIERHLDRVGRAG